MITFKWKEQKWFGSIERRGTKNPVWSASWLMQQKDFLAKYLECVLERVVLTQKPVGLHPAEECQQAWVYSGNQPTRSRKCVLRKAARYIALKLFPADWFFNHWCVCMFICVIRGLISLHKSKFKKKSALIAAFKNESELAPLSACWETGFALFYRQLHLFICIIW